jgi:hypothetical protein
VGAVTATRSFHENSAYGRDGRLIVDYQKAPALKQLYGTQQSTILGMLTRPRAKLLEFLMEPTSALDITET